MRGVLDSGISNIPIVFTKHYMKSLTTNCKEIRQRANGGNNNDWLCIVKLIDEYYYLGSLLGFRKWM